MIKFRAWYMPFGKYGAMQEMVYSRASHILALAETEPEKYIPEQFTGLKDVNGKEIYEGDIVEVTSQYWRMLGNGYEVKFKQGAFCVKYGLLSEISPSVSVIGNVHENPELLEEDK
ncbi:YopX family protein [Lactiplantibacillus plantarum]|nr:YopX family protein [Lactiplantibacillus plantarum]MCC6117092.1 YopX family protein [Lactiplantibacillus plantarum]MCW6114640.1 YopX family protein [Lactiplantibacillus plantarum]